MHITTEGTVEIPLEQLWDWIIRNNPQLEGGIIKGGVPRVNGGNMTLEIDYVASFGDDPTPPEQWAGAETLSVFKQWQELNAK